MNRKSLDRVDFGDFVITSTQVWRADRKLPRGRPHEYEVAVAQFVIDVAKKCEKWERLHKRLLHHRQLVVAKAVVGRETRAKGSKGYRLRPLPLSENRYSALDIQLLDGALHSIDYYDDSTVFFQLREELFARIDSQTTHKKMVSVERADKISLDSEYDDIHLDIGRILNEWNSERQGEKLSDHVEKSKILANEGCIQGDGPAAPASPRRQVTGLPSPLSLGSSSTRSLTHPTSVNASSGHLSTKLKIQSPQARTQQQPTLSNKMNDLEECAQWMLIPVMSTQSPILPVETRTIRYDSRQFVNDSARNHSFAQVQLQNQHHWAWQQQWEDYSGSCQVQQWFSLRPHYYRHFPDG